MDVCRANIVLLTATAAENGDDPAAECMEFYTQCMKKLKLALDQPAIGHSTSGFAVLTDSTVEQALQRVSASKLKSLFGKWHYTTPCQHSPRTAAFSRHKSTDGLAPLQDVTTFLSSVSGFAFSPSQRHSARATSSWKKLASQIHLFLDKPPWKQTEHVLLEVHWLLAGSTPPSPSSALELYGSLLRMQEWHNAHIQLVCNTSCADSGFQEWTELLKTPPMRTLSSWLVTPGVIWRGALHFTEHKVHKSGQFASEVFPGFALAVRSDMLEEESNDSLPVLKDVGLGANLGYPCHLEVVQAVDLATFPLFWRSPIQCTLFLANPSFQNSVVLMRDLMAQKSSKTIGLLVRLCFKEDTETCKQRSTCDWIVHVQEKEDSKTTWERARSPSPLASYLPGPLLLVCPSDQSDITTLSCNAWFLWRPEALSGYAATLTSVLGLQIAEDDDSVAQPLAADPVAMSTTHPLEDFWTHLANHQRELEYPPSECPEMNALQIHEWIQSKVIHRLATPDLMFGQMVAPPPSATKDNMNVGDLLSFFKDTGSPVVSELSPVAMSEPLVRIHDPGDGEISYEAIASSTPRSKKSYHGVSYCLSTADTSMDSRLSRVQQRYLVSERASNCSTSNSPRAERVRRRRPSLMAEDANKPGKSGTEKASNSGPAKGKKGPRSKLTPRKITSPMVKVSKGKLSSTAKKVSKSTPTRLGKKPMSARRVKRPAGPVEQCATLSADSIVSTEKIPDSSEDTLAKPASVEEPHTDSHQPQALRRSPRVKKMNEAAEKRDEHQASQQLPEPSSSRVVGSKEKVRRTSPQTGKRSPAKKKPESNKKRLERIIVASLKKNGMPRSHPCFRKCYTRLFILSKSFLKDVKSSGRLDTEMERVVNFNVAQVIDFEQRQADLPDSAAQQQPASN